MRPFHLIRSDARHIPLRDGSVQCVVTSPPYWGLRDYGADGQLGLEKTPEEYVENMVAVFREVRRVLRDDGVLWLNLGDTYANTGSSDNSKVGGFTGQRIREHKKGIMDSRPRAIPEGLKPKDLVGIPWRVAFALQADGWWLRSDVIWHKRNPMPESVTDRPTKAHEYVFLLAKSERYFFDAEAVRESHASNGRGGFSNKETSKWARGVGGDGKPLTSDTNATVNPLGRNIRTVWSISTKPYSGAHFATFPPDLVEPCIKAGSSEGSIVLDPFGGSGTVGQVAIALNRRPVLCDLAYHDLARQRCEKASGIQGPVQNEDGSEQGALFS